MLNLGHHGAICTEDIFVHRCKILVFLKTVFTHAGESFAVRGLYFKHFVKVSAQYCGSGGIGVVYFYKFVHFVSFLVMRSCCYHHLVILWA